MADQALYSVDDGATYISLLHKLAREDPDKAAFVFWDKNRKRTVLTRQQVWDRSRRFAAVLRRGGIVKGDIVCNTLVNSPQRLITSFGTLLAGAMSMHGQIFLADGEDILTNWRESRCKAVILDPLQKNGAATILKRIECRDEETGTPRYQGLPHLTSTIAIDMQADGSWLHSLDQETQTYVDDTVTQDDVSFIFTTSGSTGFAKLVPHTHKSLLRMAYTCGTVLGLGPESVYFNHRSLGWIGGFPAFCTVFGFTRVLVDYSLGTPEDLDAFMVHLINQERCDSGLIMPSDLQSILNALDAGNGIDKLMRVVLTGGGPCSTTTMSAIGRLTEAIETMYGSTECLFVYHIKVTDPAAYENSCVGNAMVDLEAKILEENKEEEQEVSDGETGEIYIRSPTNAQCYLNNPEKTKLTFLDDGWYRTGDVGHFNAKGQLFVYCRKANAINHKGFLHYPGWMETRINKHTDIQKSQIVGIPDPVNHEDLCLCVVTTPNATLTQDDVREFCKSLFLTSENDAITPIPKHYLFFDAFPLNSNGKVDRMVLKREATTRLGINP